jgi:hypothetical protein
MLDSTSAPPLRRVAGPDTRTTRHRFAFRGVAFEVLAGEGVRWSLPEEQARQCLPLAAAAGSEVVADVICSVRTGHVSHRCDMPARDDSREGSNEIHLETASMHVEMRRLGANRYVATAVVDAAASCASELVSSLARAVRQAADLRAGGA